MGTSNGVNVQENVPLAPLTTFHLGGPARFFIEARTEEDIRAALAFARERGLPLFILGGGSNVLVPDDGVAGVVLRVALRGITFEDGAEGPHLIAGAGEPWDAVVDAAITHGVSGIENLAGIPGTLGGAVVQNIGAYGAEFKNVFAYADIIDARSGEHRRIMPSEAAFGYRTSIFKTQRAWIITRAALRLDPNARPNLSYPDLARAAATEPLTTPAEIARAVRVIRANKFPQSAEEGTAGSFFKNPVVSKALADTLSKRYPGLPAFPQKDGVKLSLAWLLDHALSLKGYAAGPVRLYENQPLVIVARASARARAVDAFARDIAERVRAETGIAIEREVETFSEIFSA